MTTTTTTAACHKRLEGVRMKDSRSLQALVREALDSSSALLGSKNKNDENKATTGNNSNECHQQFISSLSEENARTILVEYQEKCSAGGDDDDDFVVPIRVLRSIALLLEDEGAVERVLQQQQSGGGAGLSLAFTPPPPPNDSPEHKRFRTRMERLKRKQEEAKYSQLTSNIGSNRVVEDDHVTTRSMTYAASIGLNMIVAPLSFGCLMYYFGGALLDYFWPWPETKNDFQPDIRKILVGVVSGVGMLFVEMLLFVIRTHELDRAVRRKARKNKNKHNPFSQYTSATSKTFKED